jgi:ribonuclease HI
MAEALAIRRALTVAKEQGFKKITLASDCLFLIKRVLARYQARSIIGTVVVDIKALKTDFESCSFSFTNRLSNVVVHKLAQSFC